MTQTSQRLVEAQERARSDSDISRRKFIQVSCGLLAAAVGASSLSACQSAPKDKLAAAENQVASGVVGGGQAARTKTAIWPAYALFTGGPTPDYVSEDPRVVAGYEHYPRNPFKSWIKPQPGTGSTINVFAVAYYPPSAPFENNPTWQEVNRRLNANLQMNIVASS